MQHKEAARSGHYHSGAPLQPPVMFPLNRHNHTAPGQQQWQPPLQQGTRSAHTREAHPHKRDTHPGHHPTHSRNAATARMWCVRTTHTHILPLPSSYRLKRNSSRLACHAVAQFAAVNVTGQLGAQPHSRQSTLRPAAAEQQPASTLNEGQQSLPGQACSVEQEKMRNGGATDGICLRSTPTASAAVALTFSQLCQQT